MSGATRQSLATMQRLAERVAGELSGFCDKIEIAGSIRRRRPDVSNLNLVAIPKAGELARLKERCGVNARVVSEGAADFVFELRNGVRVDIWFARPAVEDLYHPQPSNWGAVLLARTGSGWHNKELVIHAQRKGLKLTLTDGVFGGLSGKVLLASATEEDIFRALKLPFVPPENRG